MLPELHEGEESKLQMINQEPGCFIRRPLWQLSRNCHFLSTFLREHDDMHIRSMAAEDGLVSVTIRQGKKFNGVKTDGA